MRIRIQIRNTGQNIPPNGPKTLPLLVVSLIWSTNQPLRSAVQKETKRGNNKTILYILSGHLEDTVGTVGTQVVHLRNVQFYTNQQLCNATTIHLTIPYRHICVVSTRTEHR
jgi:hypothetical protein